MERARGNAAGIALSLAVTERLPVVTVWRWRRLRRTRLILSRIEAGSFWRRRRVVTVAHLGNIAGGWVDVHGHENGSGFEKLDLDEHQTKLVKALLSQSNGIVMVTFLKVSEFVDDHVVDAVNRGLDEVHVEQDRAGMRRTTKGAEIAISAPWLIDLDLDGIR